jgi:transposase InsO family protein
MRRPGLALVALSVVEQRLDAVRAVLSGAKVTEVAAAAGVSRQSVHSWMTRYLAEGLAGLADKSHRPKSCPHQVAGDAEVAVAEMRRQHPKWGAKRIRLELLRRPRGVLVPSERTINRVLTRQGLVSPRPRKRPRDSYRRWERPGPMQLWQIDIVGGVMIADERTGDLREAKVVTGVDDHSRYCVMAAVTERATGRAVCLALAAALRAFGVPEEILTDNGKQFTARFGRGGEVLSGKICRKNGITHRLTAPASPTTTGKIERFHQTLRRELLNDHAHFGSVQAAQDAIDVWVREYNADRPHQALDGHAPVTPADRFRSRAPAQRDLIDLWLPPVLVPGPASSTQGSPPSRQPAPAPASWHGGPIEFDRVVPPSGNMWVAGRQFWMGPAQAGMVIRFWAGTQLIHLSAAGARIKTLRSHLSVNDLAKLIATGAVPAGAAPLPPAEDGPAIEAGRPVSRGGLVSLGPHRLLAAEILGGQLVSIRIEPNTLMFFDPGTRVLLRTRPNPLTPAQITRLRGARPAGPPPRPPSEPIRVQRRASATGLILVCGQNVALGRAHAGQTVTVYVSDTTLAIELDDAETRVVRRTTTTPVRNIKANRPRTVPSVS